MKKLHLFALCISALFTACTNDVEDAIDNDNTVSNIKPSELFVYSGVNNRATRANTLYNNKEELGYSIPDENKYLVYYYIRIDGNIPGEPDMSNISGQYFPQTATGKTLIDDLNHGYVKANVSWKSGKFEKYIYSTDGSAVESIILEAPTIEELIAANQNKKYDLSGYLEHKEDLHFIWYTCKQQTADHIWHIDGILTSKTKTNISETDYGESQIKTYKDYGMVEDNGSVIKGEVEVDVHQQQHKDWNEIKTSIHLRDSVTTEVFIPLDYALQADDFDIRVGKDYEYVTELLESKITIGDKVYPLSAKITHEEAGIRIVIEPNKEALKAARLVYDDGITYEIHNYVTPGIPQQNIWDQLKLTTVSVTPYTYKFGQITSAYFDDRVEF